MKLGSKKSRPTQLIESSPLQTLPLEMYSEILSYLPPKDILSFAAALVSGNAGVMANAFKWRSAIKLLREAAGFAVNPITYSECHTENFIHELKLAIARITQEYKFLKEKSPQILEGLENQAARDIFADLMHQVETALQQKFNNITHLKKLGVLIDQINTHIANSQLQAFHTVIVKLRNITRITPEFVAQHQAQLSAAKSFSLENNFLATIPSELTENSQAYILNLASNQLRSIPHCIFAMPQLTTLNLANNFILDLPHNLQRMKSLRNLFLQHNKLSDVSEVLLNMPQLIKVGLTHNQIPQTKLEKLYPKVQTNDLAHTTTAWQGTSNTQLLIQQFEALSFSKKSEAKKIQCSLKSAEKLLQNKR